MSSSAKACPSCATPLPDEAAFCFMCGAATPQTINPHTGEVKYTASTRIESGELTRLKKALSGHYELGRLIGRGGFAEVFLVHDKRLKRDLALKALRPDLVLSEQLLTRFRREAETVAALRHPHIVPIYDIGEAEGVAYIIMPLIQGESLKALLLREGPRPAREASRILLEASGALGAAHEAGVIHRDIKPENIMLEGKSRRVQLMDFGIAKAIDANQSTGLTSTGLLVGTPHYMSPEQASGELHLDHRSDQYSLAVVGYQMLTGGLPFEGESTRAILFQQMVGVPKSLRDLVPDVPASLAFAIEKALAKDPKERYESMEAFADAIAGPDSWLGSGSIDTSRTSRPSVTTATTSGAQPATVETPAPVLAKPRRKWTPVVATVGVAATLVIAALLRSRGGSNPSAPAPVPVAAVPPAAADPSSASPPTSAVTPAPAAPAPLPPAAAGPQSTRPAASSSSPPKSTSTTPSSTTAVPPAGASCATAFKAADWPNAATLCRAEADRGSAPAAKLVATMFQRGNGVKQSDSLAVAYLRKAVDQNDAQAAYRLGVLYMNGTGVVRNDVEASRLLKVAAAAGIEEAWPALAERFEQGLGLKRDDQEASYWYKRAAETGLASAQYNLGDMYNRGRGVQRDEQVAAEWFSKAAEQGFAPAMYQLGMMYVRGKGLPKDEETGLQWLKKAADKGIPEAQKEVAKRAKP